ncbi:putative bifunctional diguanylate cyclase/phosphodiesterase [Sphingosinicella terrae]|uniref:putative bifunctional diguanylate cyclase/phosphodiesterase n=1 Tax=Sphingosinicella terrae TaxID=2172047 RepID=UPI000E0D0926|nr:bifunctional diguanylate cyclase/phosphodiesterase [Sphingosinicella terrae]
MRLLKPRQEGKAPPPGGYRRARAALAGLKLEALIALLVLLTWAAVQFGDALLDRSIRIRAVDPESYLAYSYADSAPQGGSSATMDPVLPLAWSCRLASASPAPYCGYGLQFDVLNDGRGLDLSGVHEVEVTFNYQGAAETLRIDLKNREPGLRETAPGAGDRINSIAFPIGSGRQTVRLSPADFRTAAWWIERNRLPETLHESRFDNVVALEMQTAAGAAPGLHRLRIEEVRFKGRLLTAAQYHGLLFAAWILVIAGLLAWRRYQAVRAAKAEAVRWRHALDSIPQMVWTVSADGEHSYSNARWAEFTGIEVGEGGLLDLAEFVHPDDRAMTLARWARCLATGEPFEAEYRLRHRSGEHRYMLGRALPERDDDGEIQRWFGTCTDIHDRVIAQQELWRSQNFTRQLIDATPDVILVIDDAGHVVFANDAAAAALGAASKSALTGRPWLRLVSPEVRRAALAALPAGDDGGSRHFVAEKLSDEGPNNWWDVILSPLAAKGGNRFLVIARDISHQKQAEEQARWSSRHDPLTRLPNRVLLQHELDRLIVDRRRPFAVMILDMDEFKKVNDTLGHDAGDALLCTLAERLVRAVGPSGLVARLGGDEFAVILKGARREKVGEVAARIFAALREPCTYEGTIIDCHTSIGASLFPEDGLSRGDLLKYADVALYVAKSSGRRNLKIFDPRMLSAVEVRHGMVSTARQALKSGSIVPYYQPKIELASGRVAGFEALLRWRDPARGMQTPDTIMAAFEDAGVASAISNRMIDSVLTDVRQWLDRGVAFDHVAFNASATELRAPDFAERLIERLHRAAIPARCVQIEVTETVFLGRGAEAVEGTLRSLSSAGVRIGLDDFGTGFASLSHLKSFPVDLLKIDRSFIRNLQTDLEDGAIVDAVIGLGRSLRIEVVAEGVETAAQHETLAALGCRYGQGFLYSRPVAAEEVIGLCSGGDGRFAAVAA